MPASITIQLPRRVIDYADERAAFFFMSNLSSVGASGFDRRVTSPQNELDRIQIADIYAINSTMMARTGYAHWTQFTGVAGPLSWLQHLDTSWNLLTMEDTAWTSSDCAARILAALQVVMGPYRTTSITTKLLHLKRPNLLPVCDSYVCAMLGEKSGGPAQTMRLITAVRDVGRFNLGALTEISKRLKSIGIDRTLVRILDSLLWSAYPDSGPDAEFARWLVQWHQGRLFF